MTWPQPNPHGAYLPEQCEVLTLPHVGTSKALRAAPLAQVFLIEIGPGEWLEATNYQFSHGNMRGGGGWPSVDRSPRHPTRDEALRAAAARLLKIASNVLDGRREELERARKNPKWEPSISAGQERETKSLEVWAKQLLGGVQEQMELLLI